MTSIVAQKQQNMSIKEFLEMEESSHVKHHYVNGQVIPMSGGTLKHNRIATNICYTIEAAIRKQSLPFIVSNSDTKIWVPKLKSFYYPDAVVICETPEYYEGRKDVLLNPLLIVQVASPSTHENDRSFKFFDYATLASFKEYLIVSQDTEVAHLSNLVGEGDWHLSTVEGIEGQIELKSIGCTISMQDVYFKTENL